MLDALLDALTTHGNRWTLCDEMDHTAGSGLSHVERWAATSCDSSRGYGENEGPWLWRVMWRPNRCTAAVRVAYGVADGEREAELAGHRAATAYAQSLAA